MIKRWAKGFLGGQARGRSLGLALAWSAIASPVLAANEIVVGQSVPLTGVAASVGIPLAAGTQAVIDAVNASGGIRGTKIKLITLDDNFVPGRSHDNVKKLVGEEKAVAVLNVIGAPNSEGLVKQNILSDANVPLIGPFTASSGVRALKSPHIFFVAAGAQHEADTMVKQARSMGLTRFGVMYQNDLFGQDGLAEVQRAAKEVGAEVAATGRSSFDSSVWATGWAGTRIATDGKPARASCEIAQSCFAGRINVMGPGQNALDNLSAAPDHST